MKRPDIRSAAPFAIPVLYVIGATLIYVGGPAWWPWQALGVAVWLVASSWVGVIARDATQYRRQQG